MKRLFKKLGLKIFPKYKVKLETFKGELSQKPLSKSQVYSAIMAEVNDVKSGTLTMKYNVMPTDIIYALVDSGHVRIFIGANHTHYYVSPGWIKACNDYTLVRITE